MNEYNEEYNEYNDGNNDYVYYSVNRRNFEVIVSTSGKCLFLFEIKTFEIHFIFLCPISFLCSHYYIMVN